MPDPKEPIGDYALKWADIGEGQPLPLALEGMPSKDSEGKPIHYRRVKVGVCSPDRWHHRGTGDPLPLPRERADEWLRNTTGLIKSGVKPYVTPFHPYDANGQFVTPDARDTLGYVERMERDADDIYAVVSLFGDDSLNVAAKNSRSVGITGKNMGDAMGNVFKGEALHHLALVPNAALPDLGGTELLAASADGAVNRIVFELALAASDQWTEIGKENGYSVQVHPDADQRTRDAAMHGHGTKFGSCMHKTGSCRCPHISEIRQIASEPCSACKSAGIGLSTTPINAAPSRRSYTMKPETAQQVRAQLGFGADVPDDQLDEKTAEKALALSAEYPVLKESVSTLKAQVTAKDLELATAKTDAESRRQENLALSASAPRMPDAVTMAMYSENVAAKRDLAIGSGAVTPAEAVLFDQLVLDSQGKPTALALSACAGKPMAFALWDTICKLGKGGLRTGSQRPGDVTQATANDLGLSAEKKPDVADPQEVAYLRQLGNFPKPKVA